MGLDASVVGIRYLWRLIQILLNRMHLLSS